METAAEYFRLFTVSQLIFLIAVASLSKNRMAVRITLIGLATSVIAYMFLPIVYRDIPATALIIAWMMAEFIPLLLLVLVWQVFVDDKPVPVWMCLLAIVQLIVSVWACYDHFWGGSVFAVDVARHAVKVLILIVVIVILWHGRDSDLVAQRMAVRTLLCLVIGGCAVAVVLVELYFRFEVPIAIELGGMFLFFVSAIVMNILLLKTNQDFNLAPITPPALSASELDETVNSNSELRIIISRMQDERLYAQHEYRISDFANALGVPEHQLRKKINNGLGFRNFNQFINSFRLAEAAERLRTEPRKPVLTIALDVGFSSISVFNTSFQMRFHMTPSEYRKS